MHSNKISIIFPEQNEGLSEALRLRFFALLRMTNMKLCRLLEYLALGYSTPSLVILQQMIASVDWVGYSIGSYSNDEGSVFYVPANEK